MASLFLRRATSAIFVGALCCAILPGCGGSSPNKTEKKEEPKGDVKVPPGPDTKQPPPTPPYIEPKNMLSPVEPGAEQFAQAFLKDLGQGTAKADSLSASLLKSVGKPLELPDDIAKGVSRDNATRWLKRVGENYSFSLSLQRQQAGNAVSWRGLVTGPGKSGGYSLRLVKEGADWKVDWLSVSTADITGSVAVGDADAAFQEFAVTSFVEALADNDGMAKETRAAILAHGMVPALRTAWAPPFDGDKTQGYDYSPGKLGIKAVEYAGGTKSFSVSKASELTYKVELTKLAGKKVLMVKLLKGANPGEWLVSEVQEAKG